MRRLGVFPAEFNRDEDFSCNTYLGDYPQFLPGNKRASAQNNSPGWMLLSYGKAAEASSTEPRFPITSAFDENIQTWLCAATGNSNEWLRVDLGKIRRIEALQINFADEGAEFRGKLIGDAYQYFIEASRDGVKWETILDRSHNRRDSVHDYAQLDKSTKARFVRLVNVHCPAGAKLSVSGFRIFGDGLGRRPAAVKTLNVVRNPADQRKATVTWEPSARAEFYIVRYGIAPDRMSNNYQIHGATEAHINALNSDVAYWFSVDAVNDSGVTQTRKTVKLAP